VDSRRPLLFYEEAFPVPGYAFDPADVRTDLLTPSTGEPPTQPFFFLPKGPVGQWYDVVAEGRQVPHAAWTRNAPELEGRLVLSWQPGVLDRWLEEDEEVHGHPRDPYKRVEALASSRHVTVSSGGVRLADTRDPVLLFETSLPTRFYVPRADVNLSALEPTDNSSACPYKGYTSQYWSVAGQPDLSNVGWSYDEPYPAVGKIAGRIAFYNELVDIEVDGVREERPVSPFSRREYRPG
jgi:uncharacterized protein (DUF427 family)